MFSFCVENFINVSSVVVGLRRKQSERRKQKDAVLCNREEESLDVDVSRSDTSLGVVIDEDNDGRTVQ